MKPMINAKWLLQISKLKSIPWSLQMTQLKHVRQIKLQSFLPYPTHINGGGMLKQSSQRTIELYNHAPARLQSIKLMLRVLIKLSMPSVIPRILIKPSMLNGKPNML